MSYAELFGSVWGMKELMKEGKSLLYLIASFNGEETDEKLDSGSRLNVAEDASEILMLAFEDFS